MTNVICFVLVLSADEFKIDNQLVIKIGYRRK